MQDLLGLDNKARMNTPSTLGGNWQWRIQSLDVITDSLITKLRDITILYGRCPQDEQTETEQEPVKKESSSEGEKITKKPENSEKDKKLSDNDKKRTKDKTKDKD